LPESSSKLLDTANAHINWIKVVGYNRGAMPAVFIPVKLLVICSRASLHSHAKHCPKRWNDITNHHDLNAIK